MKKFVTKAEWIAERANRKQLTEEEVKEFWAKYKKRREEYVPKDTTEEKKDLRPYPKVMGGKGSI